MVPSFELFGYQTYHLLSSRGEDKGEEDNLETALTPTLSRQRERGSLVISEDVINKVKLVAEGVASLIEKLDRRIDEDRREHHEIMTAIKFSYGRAR